MRRRFDITYRAVRDFDEARRWLTQPGSAKAGQARWRAIQGISRRLLEWPCLGARSPEHPGCWVVVVAGWYVVCEVEPATGQGADVTQVRVLAAFPPGKGDRRIA